MDLFTRSPDGGSQITDEGVRIEKAFADIIKEFIADIELDGPVDLRDLSMVLGYSISDIIFHEMIMRRCAPREKDFGEERQ
jgi:hypothetical protein